MDRTRFVLTGFIAGAVLTGFSLAVFLLFRGSEPARTVGPTTLPTDQAGWWALVGLSIAMGAAVGGLAGWLLSHPRGFRRGHPLRQL